MSAVGADLITTLLQNDLLEVGGADEPAPPTAESAAAPEALAVPSAEGAAAADATAAAKPSKGKNVGKNATRALVRRTMVVRHRATATQLLQPPRPGPPPPLRATVTLPAQAAPVLHRRRTRTRTRTRRRRWSSANRLELRANRRPRRTSAMRNAKPRRKASGAETKASSAGGHGQDGQLGGRRCS